MLISGLFHFAILVVSGGSWAGPVSLRKASTFGLSFGLTLALLASGGLTVAAIARVPRLKGIQHP